MKAEQALEDFMSAVHQDFRQAVMCVHPVTKDVSVWIDCNGQESTLLGKAYMASCDALGELPQVKQSTSLSLKVGRRMDGEEAMRLWRKYEAARK